MSSKKIKEIVESTGIPRDRVNELIRKKLISYELIKGSKHLNEKDVKRLMRDNLKPSSYKSWRKRVQGRSTKHLAKRGFSVGRHKSYDQNKI